MARVSKRQTIQCLEFIGYWLEQGEARIDPTMANCYRVLAGRFATCLPELRGSQRLAGLLERHPALEEIVANLEFEKAGFFASLGEPGAHARDTAQAVFDRVRRATRSDSGPRV